jgi:hypothetical protein
MDGPDGPRDDAVVIRAYCILHGKTMWAAVSRVVQPPAVSTTRATASVVAEGAGGDG